MSASFLTACCNCTKIWSQMAIDSWLSEAKEASEVEIVPHLNYGWKVLRKAVQFRIKAQSLYLWWIFSLFSFRDVIFLNTGKAMSQMWPSAKHKAEKMTSVDEHHFYLDEWPRKQHRTHGKLERFWENNRHSDNSAKTKTKKTKKQVRNGKNLLDGKRKQNRVAVFKCVLGVQNYHSKVHLQACIVNTCIYMAFSVETWKSKDTFHSISIGWMSIAENNMPTTFT